MLSREDFYMIKQMRQQGAYIVDIATQVGCSERTVRRYLKYPEPPARKTRHKMAKLRPFMDYIDMRLAENVWNGEVILAEIKAMGYTGGRSMLRYYIQPKRKMRPSKKTIRFETQPGYQLQHDWGEVEAEVAGQRCRVNFAVNTLGFSRRFHVFPQFRTGSTDIMITHNRKNAGYLINISVGQLLTEMVVPVIPDILQILTGFRCEFNGFHRQPSCQL